MISSENGGMLKDTWRWRLFSVGCLLIAGALLPWFASVDQISADERYGSMSLVSAVGGAVVLILALVGKAAKTSGLLTSLTGVATGFVVLYVIGSTFITGPPYRIGILLSALGAALGFAFGIWLLVEGSQGTVSDDERTQVTGHTSTRP